MNNFMLAIWQQITVRQRRDLRALITLFAIHFVVLVLGNIAIQCHYRQMMHQANAWFGLLWMGLFIATVWMRMGLTGDVILGTYIATNNPFARAVCRVMIGFYAVESFICICGCVVPMYANPGATGLLLVATTSYFFYRMMAGITIDWGKWAMFPLANIGLSVVTIFLSAFPSATDPDSASTGPFSFDLDPSTVMIMGIAVIILALIFGKSGQTNNAQEPTAPAVNHQEGSHGHDH